MAKAKKKTRTAKSSKKAKKAAKKGRRPPLRMASATPPSPIFVSGPNGELERCVWNKQQNIYVCEFVEGQAPADAILVQRATQTV